MKRELTFLILMVLLSIAGGRAYGQSLSDYLTDCERKYGSDADLVNGEKYFYPYSSSDGDPFFFSGSESSEIRIKGKDFESYDLDSFQKIMYKYLNMTPAWSFETLINTTKHMEKNFLTFQNIAKRLDSRSYHMKDLTSLLQAKHGNMPMSYSEEKQERDLMKSMSSHGGR